MKFLICLFTGHLWVYDRPDQCVERTCLRCDTQQVRVWWMDRDGTWQTWEPLSYE